MLNLNRFLHFYFLNMDILLGIGLIHTIFSICVGNIPIEGKVSQISHLGSSLIFSAKKRVTFVFLCIFFLNPLLYKR